MNGASKGTSGVVDLGTVITSHQDISNLALKSEVALVQQFADGLSEDIGNLEDSKQDKIADLDTIRSGAALGATALQTETYKGTVTGVKINGSTKSPTSGVVDLGTVITAHQDISGKQDKLISGSTIKTINGQSLLGSGNITISGGSGDGGTSSGGGSTIQEYIMLDGTSRSIQLEANRAHILVAESGADYIINMPDCGWNNYDESCSLIIYSNGYGEISIYPVGTQMMDWANDNPPTFEDDDIIEMSFRFIALGYSAIGIMACWTTYKNLVIHDPNSGGGYGDY